jgi:hypothetical protein
LASFTDVGAGHSDRYKAPLMSQGPIAGPFKDTDPTEFKFRFNCFLPNIRKVKNR